ncbi:membrane protein [Jannaschia pagri]|uniref:Guanidinium exporter n=1 Tax=Jannaschia pagri TaxID=2829797 RepID=A0ABQ4NQM9_9RHOB|nr:MULTISPECIES: multidrug efflux SMR transporter [unclassified Jannaschia]GIT92843.1 membrane protein [Jannaschia sp. AI_61]GIT96678.1 membrane protein [Jannaschia sp. AI_62]
MLPWILLLVAGLLEVVWATALKASDGFRHTGYAALTVVAAAGSFWLLGLAMRHLPLGTAYAVWVGIGAVGAVIFGIIWFGDPATFLRLLAIGLILLGVALLKVAG